MRAHGDIGAQANAVCGKALTVCARVCEHRRMRARWTQLVSPLRVPACRSLFAAQAISGIGDWAGRLALAALVYERSNSALWAAAVTVLALLPWLGPGQLLATFADRYGRITVMVVADLARAAAFLLMLLPQPTAMLLVWAFVAGLCVPPFAGSRSAALVELTPPDRYPAALALYGVLTQVEVLVGYAIGGVVIAVAGAEVALAANAVSFVVSAAVLMSLRNSAAGSPHAARSGIAGVVAGFAFWRSDPLGRRALLLFAGVSMFAVLPEALVVPYADQIDVPSRGVGLLAALVGIGSIIGMLATPVAATHTALLRIAAGRAVVLAIITGSLFAVGIHPVVGGLAYALSGSIDALSVPTNQVVGERLPAEGRAAAMTVAGGVLYATQALAIAGAGVVATVFSPRLALVIAMFLAAAVALATVLIPIRVRHDPDVAANH